MSLSRNLPNDDVLRAALKEYREVTTYWYVPKARTLNDENVAVCAEILHIIFEDFLGSAWTTETQDTLLDRLTETGVNEPRVLGGTLQDRTALVRIIKVLLETLGLLWVHEDQELVITDAGLELLLARGDADAQRKLMETQVAKVQYPNPLLSQQWANDFRGILPHLFLLQILQRVDYRLTFEEYELFVNLAVAQADVDRIVRYIDRWRMIGESDRDVFRNTFQRVPVRRPNQKVPRLRRPRKAEGTGARLNRIRLDGSYQRALYGYPSSLCVDNAMGEIRCTSRDAVDTLVSEKISDLRLTTFESPEAWFAYFGDPEQQPSWFTYVALAVEAAASAEEARSEIEQNEEKLSKEETATLRRLQIEKAIESSYAEHTDLLHTLEPGLEYRGRQVETPIGRIDLLCRGTDGKHVVIEIKANEATDAVFGQILRYIGWIHRNFEGGEDNVRGIILASHFPDRARYSRIGLLRHDADLHLKFRQHGFATKEA